jgi:hypothetical protein
MELRLRLQPVLETFTGMMMVTLTVDPTLFETPRDAYEYMRERRCVARTIRDLYRWGYLHSQRYFYAVEWQKETQQAHFHVLLDASYVPFSRLLESWSKHRPPGAGDVFGDRPAFGTVFISVSKFEGGAVHAARYVTKYLIKPPEYGFPPWVMQLGAETRVRRYSTSRGFWGEETERSVALEEREMKHRSYGERVESCGSTMDIFESRTQVDGSTGEVRFEPAWVGEIAVPAKVLRRLHEKRGEEASERACEIPATDLAGLVSEIENVLGRPIEWVRGGPAQRPCEAVREAWTAEEEAQLRHDRYDVDAEINRFLSALRHRSDNRVSSSSKNGDGGDGLNLDGSPADTVGGGL